MTWIRHCLKKSNSKIKFIFENLLFSVDPDCFKGILFHWILIVWNDIENQLWFPLKTRNEIKNRISALISMDYNLSIIIKLLLKVKKMTLMKNGLFIWVLFSVISNMWISNCKKVFWIYWDHSKSGNQLSY
jgi:hypothetical protein